MAWEIFFYLSSACLVLSIILAVVREKSRYKRGRFFEPLTILFMGVIVSAVLLFIPVYSYTFQENSCGIFETVFISIHNMIRLFIVDGDFLFVAEHIAGLSGWISRAYSILFSILFVFAPLLTFGFALSFLKNLSAYFSYKTHFHSDVYIFSELNEKSLTLARDLYENEPKKRFFVFTDVFDNGEEQSFELIEGAKEIGAICFKRDIVVVDFSFHSKKRSMNFFLIGEDQSENIEQGLKLIDRYKYREHANMYVFSTEVESEVLLARAYDESGNVKIKVRRINEVQSLVTRTLYEEGYEKIFKSAYEDQNGGKNINAIVIGLGQHGREMTKALSWFCQMSGYQVRIHAFDIDKKAEEKFVSLCPELMDLKLNGNFDIEGEAQYQITVHSGVDIDTRKFDDMIMDLPRTTYIFVALGKDGKNISTAMKLRSLLLRKGHEPVIHAVVYNSSKKQTLSGITNFKNQEYKIDFIGDMKNAYSEKVILYSDVEEEALKRHMKWGEEKAFWQYDYNYKSSMASAIHRKMKGLCQIPGIEKAKEERTEEELWAIRILEHRRWNAYMRSEGYVYGGTVERSGRNDMAKMHNCLVPFEQLPYEEQIKDDD
jgi:hypothetical protein